MTFITNPGGRLSRRVLFAAFCAFFTIVAAAYVVRTPAKPSALAAPKASYRAAASVSTLDGQSALLFASAAYDDTNRALMLAPRSAPDRERFLAALDCERVHFAGGTGICLVVNQRVMSTFSARLFGPDFKVRHTISLAGVPSRARVSPDGRRAVATVFVAGDSYNATGFSTRTTLIDAQAGRVIADLEQFEVSRAGEPFKAVDFNFWGVTFARDSNRFYATLASGGINYLVEGDVDRRALRVLRDGVECPSLSPDNTRIAFKSRTRGSTWRVHLLDLATMRDTPLAETRNFDDQAEWLDDETIAYSLPPSASVARAGSDIWALKVSDDAAPQLLVSGAYSPVALR
jgi:hypothetical protein